jgi:hypothetical protein
MIPATHDPENLIFINTGRHGSALQIARVDSHQPTQITQEPCRNLFAPASEVCHAADVKISHSLFRSRCTTLRRQGRGNHANTAEHDFPACRAEMPSVFINAP